MPVPPLVVFPPATVDLTPEVETSLPVAAWMQTFVASNVPDTTAAWMLAQGWQIVNTYYDDTTTPPTPYHNMTRQGMVTSAVLQSLVNVYTGAYNEARAHNALRYDNIVENWSSLIVATISDFEWQADATNTAAAAYVGALDAALNAVGVLIGTNDTAVQQSAAAMVVSLQAYTSGLNALTDNYATTAASIAAIIAAEAAFLTDFTAKYEAALATLLTAFTTQTNAARAIEVTAGGQLVSHTSSYMSQLRDLMIEYTNYSAVVDGLLTQATNAFTAHDAEVTSLLNTILADYTSHAAAIVVILSQADDIFGTHNTEYRGVLALMLSDWQTHQATTTALLLGLGVQEIARINEQWDNRAAAVQQELVDRGLYASSIIVSALAQVERERNMALVDLSDRLNREKVEDNHRLYVQQVGVRTHTLEGTGRLYGLNHEVLRYKAESLTHLQAELQDIRGRTLAAKQAVYALNQQVIHFQTEVRGSLYTRVNEVRVRTLDGTDRLYQLSKAMQDWLLDDQHKLYHEQVETIFKTLEVDEKEHAAQQEVEGKLVSQYDRLLSQLQEATKGVLDGQARTNQLQQANAEFLTNARQRLAAFQMEMEMNRLRVKFDQNAQDMTLYKFQIDAINNLIVGLFGFEERRNDVGPNLEVLGQLCSQLGDSGATSWVSP